MKKLSRLALILKKEKKIGKGRVQGVLCGVKKMKNVKILKFLIWSVSNYSIIRKCIKNDVEW